MSIKFGHIAIDWGSACEKTRLVQGGPHDNKKKKRGITRMGGFKVGCFGEFPRRGEGRFQSVYGSFLQALE